MEKFARVGDFYPNEACPEDGKFQDGLDLAKSTQIDQTQGAALSLQNGWTHDEQLNPEVIFLLIAAVSLSDYSDFDTNHKDP